MNIKSLLLGSAAALAAVSGAQAADAIVAAEPEPMEYVRVCDAFGTGYFYIPGTETCLKVGGRVRFDAQYGDVYNVDSDGTYTNTRAEIYLSSASDTEWGALKTNITARFDYNPHNDDANGGAFNDATRTRLMVATIELGGFTVGLQDSLYESFIGYAGNVINDDVINYGPSERNMAAYTYKGGNGFSAYVALEDDGQNDDDIPGPASDWVDVTGGVKFDNGTFMAGVTAGYDESVEEGAIKARLGGKFGAFSAFVMGGWNTDGDTVNAYAPGSSYNAGNGPIGWGDWALWGGAGYKFTDTVAANMQVAYTDSEIFSAAANVQWTPVSGFLIQPEVAYTSIDNGPVDEDMWSGMVRIQRTF
ncbi:Porin subfamily protein [Rhizobium sp. NFR07]|uniref:porin n=1 Tax=Rhizobium sp. NFR07 TaxID=1566262 RepID=UPI0008F40D39|nr:porin [Rhizobium sp. NFR07]SFB58605.1 Porin subfamily protein [Rhizobium sp. NFR07]